MRIKNLVLVILAVLLINTIGFAYEVGANANLPKISGIFSFLSTPLKIPVIPAGKQSLLPLWFILLLTLFFYAIF